MTTVVDVMLYALIVTFDKKLSIGQFSIEAGGNQGVFFNFVDKFIPRAIQLVKAAPKTVPIKVPLALLTGKKQPRKNNPVKGPIKEDNKVPVICAIVPPICETKIATPQEDAPKKKTEIFVIKVARDSEISPRAGFNISHQSNVDKLLSPDDNVLNEAQNREARNNPGMPGISLNMSITVYGIIWLGSEMCFASKGSHFCVW